MKTDEEYMTYALEQAKKAKKYYEVPVGAIVVNEEGNIISYGFNLKELLADPTGHAEQFAIRRACRELNNWRLTGCTVYVTLEPCIMCAGLMHQARISRCVFGAYDKKAGGLSSLYQIGQDERLNHNFEVVGGVCEEQCAKLLTDFFKAKRHGALLR